MRIALDISSIFPPRTGIGNYTLGLARALTAQCPDDEFHLLLNSLRRPTPEEEFLRRPNVRLHRRRWPGPALLTLWQWFERPRVERFVGAVDVFHSPATYVPPQRAGARITTIHDLWFLDHLEQSDRWGGRYHARRLRKVARELDAVIADSQFTARQASERLQVDEERLSVVYPGLDPRFKPAPDDPRLAALRDASGRVLPREFILTVSTDEPRKNLPRLLEAYGRLVAREPETPPLVVAGMTAQWWTREELRRRVEPLAERVFQLGFVADDVLPPLYSAAQLFVFPSLCEGFGFPVLEAMACGTPVACSRGSSLDEIRGDAALPFDAENTEELADAVARALADDGLRRDLSQRGLKQAAAFNWERTADEVRKVYGRVHDAQSPAS